MIKNIKKFIKKRKKLSIILLILVLVIVFPMVFSKKKGPDYDSIIIEKGSIIQEVSVTGKTKSMESINLAFEGSGKVSRVYVGVNEEVKKGDLLISLDNNNLYAQLQQYEADLSVQESKLTEIKKGVRAEELFVSEKRVESAQQSLADAKTSLINTKNKAEADLQNILTSSLTSMSSAVNAGVEELITLTNIQDAHYFDSSQNSVSLASKKEIAVKSLLGGENAGRINNDTILRLTGGAKGDIKIAEGNPTEINIIIALGSLEQALIDVRDALNSIPVDSLTSTELTNLSSGKTSINSEIITISGKKQSVNVQKYTNNSAVFSAQSSVNNYENALIIAQSELDLKKAGSSEEQINIQEAQVERAKAVVSSQRATIEKNVIRAPIDGIVSRIEASAGEIVYSNTNIVSLISKKKFEIEANVTEVDISKISNGDSAKVTLDAYDSSVVFEAEVISMDLSETIIEGVTTYKVVLHFKDSDERIRSGMTANVDILTDMKEGVISISQRAVKENDEGKYVQVLEGKEIKDVMVTTGLRGSDGNIEILSGLEEGMNVITFINDKK
jgi:RND family efflux transporter MFP subunit